MEVEVRRVSYSQYSYWNVCPFSWKLLYIDKLGTYTENIFALFGTSMHEVIQKYLTTMYGETIKKADELPLEKMLKEQMEYNHEQAMDRNDGNRFCTKEDMEEFYGHGLLILDWFKKRRANYFSKKHHDLIGVEVPLNYNISDDMKFIGYVDILLYDKTRDRYKIIDIKTSTMGWNKYMKFDKNRTNQLLLYKHFYGLEHNIPVDKIDVEYFIVKRKLYENADFPERRIQEFSPASGKPSMNKIMDNFNRFLDESFIDNKYNESRSYEKIPSKKNCRFCDFNQTEHCDQGVK